MKKSAFIVSTLASSALVGSVLINGAFASPGSLSEDSWQQLHRSVAAQGFVWTGSVANYLSQKGSVGNSSPINGFLDTNTSKNSDKIVVSDWYYQIFNLSLNLTDGSYAFGGVPNGDTANYDKMKNISDMFISLVYNGKVIQKNKPIVNFTFQGGDPLRYTEWTLSGSQPQYDDIAIYDSVKIGDTWYDKWDFQDDISYNAGYISGVKVIKKSATLIGSTWHAIYSVEKDGKRVSGDFWTVPTIFKSGDDIWVLGHTLEQDKGNQIYKNGELLVDTASWISDLFLSADGKNYVYSVSTDESGAMAMYVNGKVYQSAYPVSWVYGIVGDLPVYLSQDSDSSGSYSLVQGGKVLQKFTNDTLLSYAIVSGDAVYTIFPDRIIAYKNDKKYTYMNPYRNTVFEPYAEILGDKIFLLQKNTMSDLERSITIPLSMIIR